MTAGALRDGAAIGAPHLEIPSVAFDLSCGALLLVSPRRGAPVTALVVSIDGGARLDPVGQEGLAQLAGSLAVEGTARHTEAELAAILEPLGGSLVGDSSGLSGSVAGSHWRTLLDLAAEVLTAPTFPEERVARQKAIALERLRVDEAEPRVQVGRLFNRLVYGDHGIGRPRRGTYASVGRIEREHVVRWHREQWHGARAIVGLCGDLDPAAVRDHLEAALAEWAKGEPAPPLDDDFPPVESRVATFRAERQQVQVLAGHLAIERKDPRYAACVVMDHVLGTGPGFTDRIGKRLRDEEGLAYSVGASTAASAGRVRGTFQASITTSPDKVRAALVGFVEEMQRIRTEPVGADELDLVRRYLSGSYALGFEKASRRASHVVIAERLGLPEGHLDELLRELVAVDAEQVLACAREVLHPEALSLAVAGPLDEAEVRAALDAALSGGAGPPGP